MKKLLSHSVGLTHWVSSILNSTERLLDVSYFADLIDELWKLNNYNSVYSILLGIRKSKTKNCRKLKMSLDNRRRHIIDCAKSLFPKGNNFKQYLKVIRNTNPYVPCFHIIQLQIDTQFEADSPPITDLLKVNFSRCRALANLLQDYKNQQTRYPSVPLNPKIQEWLTTLMNPSDILMSSDPVQEKSRSSAMGFRTFAEKFDYKSEGNVLGVSQIVTFEQMVFFFFSFSSPSFISYHLFPPLHYYYY
jgi:hypothetical protein